jgi:hypothetical protein
MSTPASSISAPPVRRGAWLVRSGDRARAGRRRRVVEPRRSAARAWPARGVARSRSPRAFAAHGFPRGGDQPRQRASEARSSRGGARRLSPGKHGGALVGGGPLRPGAGLAQSRPLPRGDDGVRGGRSARQSRGSGGQRLPHADARGLRSRTRGIRGALASGKVAWRGARHPLQNLEGAGTAGRARSGAQRSRSRRHHPVLSLSAAHDRRRRRGGFRLSVEDAAAPVFEGQGAVRRFAVGG